MIRLASLLTGLAVAVAIAVSAPLTEAGEMYGLVGSTQKFQGDLPAGEALRLEFPLAAGSEPRITITLLGSKVNQPVSFSEAHLIGPDGQEIFLPAGQPLYSESHSTGRDSLSLGGWTTTQSGRHQLLIQTNARILTRAKGRFVEVRATRIPIAGDETSVPVQVALQPGDTSRVSVKRVSGTAPRVASYKLPSGTTSAPGQKTNAKGSTSNALFAVQFGVHEYAIGYQAVPAAGAWKGPLIIKPFKGGTPAYLRLRNSPGVPLSVRDADRSLIPTFAGADIGVATDGNYVMVSSVQGGILTAQAFDRDLQQSPAQPNPVQLMNPTDFTAGEVPSGHRVMFMGGFYFFAVSTASGAELAITRVRTDFLRDGFATVVSTSTDPTTDFFLAGDGTNVSLGIFQPSNGHTVHLLKATDFGIRSTVAIGGAQFPQKNGSGVAWRSGDKVFEMWTPGTLDFHGPSDLHRVLYSAAWSATTADAKPVADLAAVETMPTAVSVDPVTGATIVHYVVADNPPLDVNLPGSGRVHRRVFDATGAEVPGSLAILPRVSCNRPTSVVTGSFLYVGFETPNGPVVERYSLLR
jgi:hypothetical protein